MGADSGSSFSASRREEQPLGHVGQELEERAGEVARRSVEGEQRSIRLLQHVEDATVLEQAGGVYEEIVLDELTNPEHVALGGVVLRGW